MKHGYGIVDELHSGLSHLLEARGIPSVEALIGRALPDPVTDFMALSAVKKISAVQAELCQHCGNCTRCPYLAVSLNADKVPTDRPVASAAPSASRSASPAPSCGTGLRGNQAWWKEEA
jgi:hypothetical protein